MRPRNLAWAGLAVASFSTLLFFLLDEPAHDRVSKVTAFDADDVFTISEQRPDPPPHAFALNVPRDAQDARLHYFFRFAGPDRPGGQEASINVIMAIYVDGERGTYEDKTPLGEKETSPSGIDYGQSHADIFQLFAELEADVTPGFHVIQFRVDTTDRMTEDWEWTFTPVRQELHYKDPNGWRGGWLPLAGLIFGLGAALFLGGLAVQRAVLVPPR